VCIVSQITLSGGCMNTRKYTVKLTQKQRKNLQSMVSKGKHSARVIKRANILLLADKKYKGKDIARIVSITEVTISKLCRRFQNEGLDALYDKPRSGQPPKLDGKAEAKLTAIACSTPPQGHARWTVRLLADEMVRLELVDSICPKTVWSTLKKTTLNRGKNTNGVSST